ncbi:Os04g0607566 [Oryza sativa Japonica Group]|uniref:Os04g0607566 protein n=1 Tax=Oryza sativa subsp. japonica TaxID=39947 RepID=A0A0P0WEI7_ORYSJ|nr:hypothetical protein EE612_025429 [Oryza sativa]BAS90911.1 Os04g0607566 [Oryza sativa Japonica Group]
MASSPPQQPTTAAGGAGVLPAAGARGARRPGRDPVAARGSSVSRRRRCLPLPASPRRASPRIRGRGQAQSMPCRGGLAAGHLCNLASPASKDSIFLLVEGDLFGRTSFVLVSALLKCSASIEMDTSPPNIIRSINTQSCWLEKSSISTVAMLETAAVDTEVNIKSRSLGVGLCRGLRIFRARKPTKDIEMNTLKLRGSSLSFLLSVMQMAMTKMVR